MIFSWAASGLVTLYSAAEIPSAGQPFDGVDEAAMAAEGFC